MSTIEIPDGVTHWSCSRLDKASGVFQKLLWGSDGRVAVGTWKVPSSGDVLAKRVMKRWGPGMYKVQWVRTRDTGKREGAGHVEFRIEDPANAPPPPQAGAGAPHGPPGYPAPYGYPVPGAPPPGFGMPFDPLQGFRTLFEYAGNIRGQERDDANERAERYRTEMTASIERERMALQERLAERDRVQRMQDDQMKREHELALARVQAELAVSREQISSQERREQARREELEERLDELADSLEEQKTAGATAGQQALAILQTVIDRVGGPLGDAAATAIKNGALKGAAKS